MSLPPVEIPLGAMRFNSDSQKLEYFNGYEWMQIHTFNPDLNGGARGIYAGGNAPGGKSDVIEYINISSSGNGVDFGDMVSARGGPGGCGSRTRGIIAGGGEPSRVDKIDYITIASTGNATDFGNLTQSRSQDGNNGGNSATRGLFAAGTTPSLVNTIDYVTIAQTGNAVDFGDLVNEKSTLASVSSSTRGIIQYGAISPSPEATLDYITMASTGNASSFGTLDGSNGLYAGGSSSTRGLFAGGYITNIIQYITTIVWVFFEF